MRVHITIVMYHYVRDTNASRFPGIKGISPSDLENQIAYFTRFYSFVTVEQCLGFLRSGDPAYIPDNPILLTFDDGYIDHYDNVFPILRKHGIQGAFFPVVKMAEREAVLDVNKIHFILASTSPERIIEDIKRFIRDNGESFDLPSFQHYYNALAAPNHLDSGDVIFVKRLLQRDLPPLPRSQLTDALFRKYVSDDEKRFAVNLYMGTGQIAEMLECGMHIGLHSRSHRWMDTLSPGEQLDEIKENILFLKKIGAHYDAWTVAYPYGAYNTSLLDHLKSVNCEMGFTTKVDIAELSTDNALTLERYDTIHFPFSASARPNEITRKSICEEYV